MSFMQIFKKPGQKAYSYQVSASSLADATQLGQEFAKDNPLLWGEFLYARSPHQKRLTLGQLYVLTPSRVQVRYREETEELHGPFDYLVYSGPHRQDLGFPLTWKDPISGGTVSADCLVRRWHGFQVLGFVRKESGEVRTS